MGDATNLVLILGGELLKKAENLLIMGLHPSEIIKGYELASAKAQAELESTSSFLFLSCTHQASTTILKSSPFRFHLLCSNSVENKSLLESPTYRRFYFQFLPNAVATVVFREPH